MTHPTVAIFRPDDSRLVRAVEILRKLGATPITDPMLAVEPTGAVPTRGADYLILTSRTGAELLAEHDWDVGEAQVVAIGTRTAAALEKAGYSVDIIPETASSAGLVDTLTGSVANKRIEVARSDHGSTTLIDGLESAGATVTETVLYRLTRPTTGGQSIDLAVDAALDAALFTSSLTVEHWIQTAADRDNQETAVAGLSNAVVGAIGDPTRQTAIEHGIDVDVVPSETTFKALAQAAIERLSKQP